MIREQEPPKPSTKLSTADGCRRWPPTAGRSRPSSTKLVRGELDWIVMKALEKDRTAATRRPTASRWTSSATWPMSRCERCPPSAAYRLRKFVRKTGKAAGGGRGRPRFACGRSGHQHGQRSGHAGRGGASTTRKGPAGRGGETNAQQARAEANAKDRGPESGTTGPRRTKRRPGSRRSPPCGA